MVRADEGLANSDMNVKVTQVLISIFYPLLGQSLYTRTPDPGLISFNAPTHVLGHNTKIRPYHWSFLSKYCVWPSVFLTSSLSISFFILAPSPMRITPTPYL